MRRDYVGTKHPFITFTFMKTHNNHQMRKYSLQCLEVLQQFLVYDLHYGVCMVRYITVSTTPTYGTVQNCQHNAQV